VSKPLGGFKNGVKVIVLHQFDSAILQDFGMYASSLKLRSNCADPRFGFVESAGRIAPSELAVLSVLQTGKRKYRVEVLSPGFKLLISPDEPSGNQERLYKVNY